MNQHTGKADHECCHTYGKRPPPSQGFPHTPGGQFCDQRGTDDDGRRQPIHQQQKLIPCIHYCAPFACKNRPGADCKSISAALCCSSPSLLNRRRRLTLTQEAQQYSHFVGLRASAQPTISETVVCPRLFPGCSQTATLVPVINLIGRE